MEAQNPQAYPKWILQTDIKHHGNLDFNISKNQISLQV